MSNNALIIVDVQNDFLPGGALGVTLGDKIIPLINRLAPEFHYVVTTQDWHWIDHCSFSEHPEYRDGSWPKHCVQNTYGAELAKGLPKADAHFLKGYDSDREAYSGFDGGEAVTGSSLHDWLRERHVKNVTVVGLALDYCVKATALDAAKHGYKTTVALSATRPVNDKTGAEAEADLLAAGVRLSA